MVSYVKFKLDDETEIYVETAETPRGSSGLIPHAREAEHEGVSFQKSIEAVRKMAELMVAELRDQMEQKPDEMQFNFGLKASGELGGLIVSRGGMESNFNVMLRWRPEAKEDEKKEE